MIFMCYVLYCLSKYTSIITNDYRIRLCTIGISSVILSFDLRYVLVNLCNLNHSSFLHLQILNLLFMLLFAKILFEILIKYLF